MQRPRSPRLAALACAAATLPLLGACAAAGPAAGPVATAAPDLSTMPWADQPDGSPGIREVEPQPSLGFPAGTSYPEALTQLLVAAVSHRPLPGGVAVLDPLPPEVVYVEPADPGTGVRVSLTAPWGWAPGSGAIRPPSLVFPSSMSAGEAERAARELRDSGRLPEGARVDVPDLPACQVAHGDPGARPRCG